MRRRSFSRQTLLIPATVLALASACSTTDDDGTAAPDATTPGNADARPMVFADARPMVTPDSGTMRVDSGPTGQYCAMGGNVTVDGDQVPVRHFGCVLGWDEWQEWSSTFEERGVKFVIEPPESREKSPKNESPIRNEVESADCLEFRAAEAAVSSFCVIF